MQYGIVITTGDPRTAADLAAEAEAAGWDGVFTYDAIAIGDREMWDPWIILAAMAARTERIRLGAMVFAPSRRRPWKLAREIITLDHLSNGRLVVPVGLGALDDAGFGNVGEPVEARTRARLLDETLAIIDGLQSGEPFAFEGEHYRFGPMTFRPTTGPAAAGPGLGRGRVAARAVDAPGDPLGRARGAGPGARRQAGDRPRGPPRDRGLGAARRAAGRVSTGRSRSSWMGARRPTTRSPRRRSPAPTRRQERRGGSEADWTNSSPEALRARIQAGPPRG